MSSDEAMKASESESFEKGQDNKDAEKEEIISAASSHDDPSEPNNTTKASHHEDHKDEIVMPFYTAPKQRQRWGDNQIPPHTEWGDIFFDLFYVAAAYNLGNLLRADPTARGLLYLVGCFLPIIGLWNNKMYFDARYYVKDDMFHRLFQVAILVPLATAVLHIRSVSILSDPENHIDMFAFSVSILIGYVLALVRLIELMVCAKIGTEGLYPEAFFSTRRDTVWMLVPTSFYAAATIYSAIQYYGSSDSYASVASDANYTTDDHRVLAETANTSYAKEDDVAIWVCLGGALASIVFIAAIITVYFPWYLRTKGIDHKKVTVPMNIDYTIHRYGEFVMLMLGESVLSLLIVDLSEGWDYYKTFFSGIVTVILLEYLHFRSQPHEPDDHAMRRSKNAGVVFSILMQVYSVALVILGTCYKMFLLEFVYENAGDRRLLLPMLSRWLAGGESPALRFETDDRQERIAHFFSGSLALVWFCMDAMSIAHRGLKANTERCQHEKSSVIQFLGAVLILCRVGLIVFIATLSQYVTKPEVLAFVGLCGVLAQLTLRGLGTVVFPPDEDEEEDEAIERMANYTAARLRSSQPDRSE